MQYIPYKNKLYVFYRMPLNEKYNDVVANVVIASFYC